MGKTQAHPRQVLHSTQERNHRVRSQATLIRSDRGFLVYIHLTAEMWRGDRDEEGWKIKPGRQKNDDESVMSCQTLSTARGGGLNSSLEEDVVMDYALRRSGDKQPLYAPQDGLTPIVPRLIDDIAALHHR